MSVVFGMRPDVISGIADVYGNIFQWGTPGGSRLPFRSILLHSILGHAPNEGNRWTQCWMSPGLFEVGFAARFAVTGWRAIPNGHLN